LRSGRLDELPGEPDDRLCYLRACRRRLEISPEADARANFPKEFPIDGSDAPQTTIIPSRSGLVTPGVPVELRFEPLPLVGSGSAEFQILRRADVSLGARPRAERAPSSGNGLDELAHTGSSTRFGPSTVQDHAIGSIIPAVVAARCDWLQHLTCGPACPQTRSLDSGVFLPKGQGPR
jgi:hypothetical protein